MLHSITDGKDEPDTAYPTDRSVFVTRDLIMRVELRYVRQGKTPIGFTHDSDGLADIAE